MPLLGGYCVNIDKSKCSDCGICVRVCPYSVYEEDEAGRVHIVNDMACVGCRICMDFCPHDATHIKPAEPETFTRGLWTFQTVEEIHHKAETGKYSLRGFGTMGQFPHFDQFVVVPSQLASEPPKDKYREDCNTEVVIGEGRVDNPMRLKVPVIIAGMSFGALSYETKLALATGVAMVGSATNTGEGGTLPEEYARSHGFNDNEAKEAGHRTYGPGGYLVVQWSTGRWGVGRDYLRNADAVEIKFGQGAKPGMGGHLLGAKVGEMVALVRGIPVGTDALSPPNHYDMMTIDDIGKQIEVLRDVTDYKVPIILKLGPSRPYKDVKLAVELGFDAISLDGFAGGTGCSPELVTQGAGIPTIACIPPARRALEELGVHRDVKLIAMGGIRHGLDAVKAMALGADAVGIGAAAEIALGCRACMACHVGNCPYGIATTDPILRKRMKPEVGGQRLANFIMAVTEEIKILTMLSGHDDIRQLSEEDLRALDLNAAAMTGVKLAGYERQFPSAWEEVG